tara:strand:- start:872 stop:1480 length:609 start_codon:yes stop_codon:yes gene_type:complete
MAFTEEDLQGVMQLAAAGTPLVMGALAKRDAKDRATAAAKEANELGKQLKALEENRQQIRNPYANLGVATQAAEMEAQEADASLANTLDTMRAGGFGASGATALARQAAKAKQGISADIQKQEQANQTKFAEGEKFVFEQQEERDAAKLDRLANLQEGYQQREMDALAGQQAINQQTAGAVTGVLGQIAENPEAIAGLFGGG